MRANTRLTGALAAITAAVVGVILSFSVWFSLHVLFGHAQEVRFGVLRWYGFDPASVGCDCGDTRRHRGSPRVSLHVGLVTLVAIMAVLGIAVRLASSA